MPWGVVVSGLQQWDWVDPWVEGRLAVLEEVHLLEQDQLRTATGNTGPA